ncbi:Fluconazole resistance protein 1 [Cladophialophora chaetospira]|uniref:Fluconazole resistance protein 1 n=1 Tax=Cladophialophora chaetospira TaxID=386627 RepID=A0AA38WVZ7_9EURO|nr:Fluconazole resistance protein 1 [Cladophialophora chaetospira]
MDRVPVKDAQRITRFASFVRPGDLETELFPEGESITCGVPSHGNTGSFIHSYVELLEIQQQQLIKGIQKLYQYMKKETAWIGAPLKETNDGRPLTHDILERLGVMEPEDLTSRHAFEADLEVLQQKLSRACEGDLTIQQASSDALSHGSHHYISQPVPRTTHLPTWWNNSRSLDLGLGDRVARDRSTRHPAEFCDLPSVQLSPSQADAVHGLYAPIMFINSVDFPVVEDDKTSWDFFNDTSKSWRPYKN